MGTAVEVEAAHVVGHRAAAEAAELLVHDDRAARAGDDRRRRETTESSADDVHVGGRERRGVGRDGVVRDDVHA